MLKLIEERCWSSRIEHQRKFLNEYYAVDGENYFTWPRRIQNALKRERITLIEHLCCCSRCRWYCCCYCCCCFCCFGWLTFKIPVFLCFLRIQSSFSYPSITFWFNQLIRFTTDTYIHAWLLYRCTYNPTCFHCYIHTYIFLWYENVIESNIHREREWKKDSGNRTIYQFQFHCWNAMSVHCLWLSQEKFMVQ